jgi:hypothetical protein
VKQSQMMSASEIVTTAPDTDSAVKALIKAERNGKAQLGNLTIWHTGYVDGARTFEAATSLYAVSL